MGATRLTRALLFATGVLMSQSCVAVAPEIVFRLASRSVAMVYAIDSSRKIVSRGSGVFVDKDLLVTTCHVIARGKEFLVGHAQQRLPARLIAYTADRDLCALDVRGLDVTPARIGDAKKLQVGQRVYAIATPEGFELTFSDGLISGLRETAGGVYIQTTAPVSEGSSGGGLFDIYGHLIGIVSFTFSAGQNLNFAVPADWALDLAKRASAIRKSGPPSHVELPPNLTSQWRPPFLKQ